MSAENAVIAELVIDDSWAAEERRLKVQALRVRRLSNAGDRGRAERDREDRLSGLEWIRLHHVECLGPGPGIDPT